MDKRLFEKRCKYSIRKFSLGVASVVIGATFFGTSTVLADTAQTGSTAVSYTHLFPTRPLKPLE